MRARPGLSDAERFPLATPGGRELLARLREHPSAPRYNFACGDRLDAEAIERVRAFEAELLAPRPAPSGATEARPWIAAFVERCLREVPFYRKRSSPGSPAADLALLPTCGRDDLGREPWSFVPDGASLEGLMVYYTSGTSGRPIEVLSHPEAAAKRVPLFRAALRAHGAGLDGGEGRVAIAFVCSQRETLTYASLSGYLGGAGNVKVNLHPSEWRDPGDAARFLEDCRPEIVTGDPLSFSDLAELPLSKSWRPRGMISSAMALLPATRRRLEERFGCPVVDVYSTCESGPIAHAIAEGRHRVLPRDLHVEVVDEQGRPCPPGTRGEIALTGGRSPFLPLLRYRTGDFASLEEDPEGGAPVLVGLHGRAPVVFRAEGGRAVNNIDVTTALRPFALAEFSLRQAADGSFKFLYRGPEASASQAALDGALRAVLGPGVRLAVSPAPAGGGKLVPFVREEPKEPPA